MKPIYIVFLVLAVPAFAQTPIDTPVTGSMTPTDVALIVGCIGSILAFLGTVANMFFTNYKEARNRRWHIEDAARAKAETERLVRHVGANVENVVTLKSEEAKEAREKLSVQVAEVTKAVTNGGPKEVIVANPNPIVVTEVK